MRQLAPLAVAVPLVVAAGLVFVHAVLGRAISDLVGVAAALASTVMCLLLLIHVSSGIEVYWFGGWHPRGNLAIGIDFAVDGIGAGLATFVSLLMVLALLYSTRHLDVEHPYYQVLMLVFMAGMVGFVLSGDLFNMFVMFEVMSVAAVALVAYKVHERAALEGGLNFAVINTIGAFMFLLGIGLIYSRTGALNLAQIGHYLGHSGNDMVVVIAFALIAAALLIKAAVVPFHFWLADAYAVALTPVCLLLAGAMSEMGIYGLARIYFSAFSPALAGSASTVRVILVVAGLVTAGWGAFMSLSEDHLKRLLAFVTISFVGIFLVGVGLLTSDGAAGVAVYVVADGFGKALLFACAGILQHRLGQLSQRRLYGRARRLRLTGALFVAGGLLVASIPPFGPFLGKSMIDDAAIKVGYGFVPPLIVLFSCLCGAAVLRAAGRIFWGWGEAPEGDDNDADAETEPESDRSGDRTPGLMVLPSVALLVGAVATGVGSGLPDLATTAAHRLTDFSAYHSAVYGAAPGTLSASSSAPEWYDYLYGALTTVLALGVAGISLWGRRLGAAWIRVQAGAAAAIQPLKRTHTGRIGDYGAGLALGLGLLMAAMLLTLR